MAEMGLGRRALQALPVGVALALQEALRAGRGAPGAGWPRAAYDLLLRQDLAALAHASPADAANETSNNSAQDDASSAVAPPRSGAWSSGGGCGAATAAATAAAGAAAAGKAAAAAAGAGGGVGVGSVGVGVGAGAGAACVGGGGGESDEEDGMETLESEVLRLRFSEDRRVGEARRLLRSSRPVRIAVAQRPEVSDHEFIEEQERHLYALCTRTMALPVGRGMLTLRTAAPVPTEPLPIPRLCLTGRAPPRGTAVDLTHIEVVLNMNLWPLFHNGVAAGLRLAPPQRPLHSAWIVYNKPKGATEVSTEHAGFLMALGLNGHLGALARWNAYEYLAKCQEMTSVGLLLGIAATKRGTMDVSTTKMLSLHVEALLPPTSVELDIAQNVQVAALLGVGLVYQGTAHRRMAEVLLAEIGRPPGPEMENCVDRESYALAAGLALGLVVLGRGSSPCGLQDLHVPDALHHYMVGGHRRPFAGSQKEKYKSPSYQIREGDQANVDVTSPGATLALGMMFFDSGNRAVADWMLAPSTQYLLDFVRPDFLLLRVCARAMVLWREVRPTAEWVEAQAPAPARAHCLLQQPPSSLQQQQQQQTSSSNNSRQQQQQQQQQPSSSSSTSAATTNMASARTSSAATSTQASASASSSSANNANNSSSAPEHLDLETMNQAHCNAVAGACLALGLRFAGSCDEDACRTLLHYARAFASLGSRAVAELAGRATVEACLSVALVALAMVMAGSGDVRVLRLCRRLRARVGSAAASATYGSHLATHMALGMLFLGGGRLTLAAHPAAAAALLAAAFPKWPTHSNDNRYHLQAFRHLYVLAVEERLLLPRDIDTRRLCFAHLTIHFLPEELHAAAHGDAAPCKTRRVRAPALLPELSRLSKVVVEDDRYWTIEFNRETNWDQLETALRTGVWVKACAGRLSHLEDPQGFRSLLAETLTRDPAAAWSLKADSISAFTSDPAVLLFAKLFLDDEIPCAGGSVTGEDELRRARALARALRECVAQDKLHALSLRVALLQCVWAMAETAEPIVARQLRLASAVAEGVAKKQQQQQQCHRASSAGAGGPGAVLSAEAALALRQAAEAEARSWLTDVRCRIGASNDRRSLLRLAAHGALFGLPPAPAFTLTYPATGKKLNPLRLREQMSEHRLTAGAITKMTALFARSKER